MTASVPRHAIASGDGMTCSSDQSPLNNKKFQPTACIKTKRFLVLMP